MRCTNCNAENPESGKFCLECGAPLIRACTRCGSLNPLGSKFCGECGERLLAPKAPSTQDAASDRSAPPNEANSQAGASGANSNGSADRIALDDKHPPRFAPASSVTVAHTANVIEGERKTVTALFADIKGSTELMEDLDPEEAQALVDPALALMIEAVRHFDGYIVQSTGDGIFALFGAPVAREDHPQRALHAALRMQDELRNYGARLRAEGRPPIEIRVGINTGEVVVRSIQTGARDTEYTPIGHTTNLAARLQTIASTGSIVVSKETEQIVAGYFKLKSLGEVRIRGLSDPLEVFEVLGVGPLRTRLQASALRGLSKFVGRTRETEKLMAAFESVKHGHGQVVAAIADAGVGKSRLFHEFKAVVELDAMTLEAYSVSHGRASAYLPVIDLLNDYFAIVPEDDRRRRREKIGGKILMLDRELEDTLPYLIALLGVEAGEANAAERQGDGPLAGMDAHERRRGTLKAIQRILLRESLNQPLILVFEDLHWVDGATQGLLDLMAESIAPARILMLVNYRPLYQHRWSAQPNYTELRLEPLGLAGASQMLDELLDSGGEATRSPASNGASGANPTTLTDLKRFIIDKTEGNPFFIEEMVRTLFERGALKRNGGLEIVTPLDEIRIPPTVNGILAARIDRLAADEKELVQTLAVIGKEFTLSLVKRVVPAEITQQVEAMLSALQAGEFIYEEPVAGESKYYFKHALTQEVAYGSLLSERRKLLHERIAAAIEDLYSTCLDDYVAAVAYHYGRSGNQAKAVEYLSRAGLQAARRAAYGEAVERLAEGIALLLTLPATPDRDRQELVLQSALGQYLIPSKGVAAEEVRIALERARDLAGKYGTEEDVFWIVYGIQFHYVVRLDLTTARAIGECQLASAERSGDPSMRMAAYVAMAQTLVLTGEPEAARDLCERAIKLPRELSLLPSDPAKAAQSRASSRLGDIGDARVMIFSIWASVLATTGYPDQSLRRSAEAVALARSAGPHSLIVAINSAAELRFRLRDWDGVLERVAEVEMLAEQRELPLWSYYARALRGQVFVHLDRMEEGIDLMKTAAASYETTPATGYQWRIHYADALGRLGRAGEALTMLTEIEGGLAAVGWAWSASELRRLRGEFLLTRNAPGDVTAAEASFRAAIAVAHQQHARLLELRAANALARLLDSLGRRDEARATLEEIYMQFTEGFEVRDLREARALLERFAERATLSEPR